jgi:hypothetical protein
MLLLDLNLANIARMLNDFRYVCLVSSSNFAGNALAKVRESTIHPVLPEDTDSIAEGRKIRFDHAEGAVNGPKDEEDDEQMVGVPEALEVGSSCLFSGSEGDCH